MAETTTTDHTTSATDVVDASPEEVFDFVRRPANHAIISGNGTVQGNLAGPERLGAGDRFGMSMKMGVPYRIRNTVVEFEQDRRIAWCHPGRHRWRWEVEPTDDGRTRVTETFDMGPSPIKFALKLFMGLPDGHTENVRRSVENVRDHFAG